MGQKQIFQTALTDLRIWSAGQTVPPEQLGTIRTENNAVYKYVAFTGTTTIAVGDALSYIAYASDGQAVQVDGAHAVMGAGIAVAALASGSKAAGATYYATGWIQVEGIATVSQTPAGAPTIGQGLKMSTSANATLTVTTAIPDVVYAICYDATAKVVMCTFPY